MHCSHISKVVEWGFDENHDFMASLWGCVLCDETSDKPFKSEDDISIDHTACDEDCFGCKAKGLQLNTGDASRDIPDKKWNSELKAYRSAREQGIQPSGTRMHDIEAAHQASETLGQAYDGDTMIKTKDITPKSVEIMKEIGQI
jgi:hypothetical protein